MKKLIMLLVVLFSLVFMGNLIAATVEFEWDANTETDLKGYRIHQGIEAGNYTETYTILCGPNDTTCTKYTLENLPDGTYFWAATAFDTNENESEYSNEISLNINTIAPGSPKSFKVIIKDTREVSLSVD